MNHLRNYFKEHPVIAGVRNDESLNKAINSNVIALFLLYGDIMSLEDIMTKARDHDKLVFLHLDFIKGIGQDKKGIEYLAVNNLCDGIVTTRTNLIKAAKKEGLMAVQRLFLLDSGALKTGESLMRANQPDALEILPGIAAPYFIDHVKYKLPCPIIAGGLIRKKEEVADIIAKGVMAVSSSNSQLWV